MGGFAPFLPEAVEAVLGERPAAVVVVDDGAAVPVPPQPAGVAVVRRAIRGGAGAARATGVEALPPGLDAIAFCDADDTWAPGSLPPRIDALRAGAAWCFGAAEVVGPDGRPTGERWRTPAGPLALDDLFVANPVPISSVLVRRDALAAAGGPDQPSTIVQDWELWLALAALGHLPVAVPDAVVRYRRHPGGLSADVACMAAEQRALHVRRAALVGPRALRAALARDDAALAASLPRRRGALAAWARAAARGRPSPRPLLQRRRAG